jgi:hypothetical protein
MFLLLFIVGLGLTSLTAQRFTGDGGGIDQREGAVLLIMAILVALGLMFQALIRVTEIRHGVGGIPDPDDETDPEELEPDELEHRRPTRYVPVRPTEAPATPPPAKGWQGNEPEHTLTRTWEPRPDQKLPPAHPDDQEPGTAERIMQARERGERT